MTSRTSARFRLAFGRLPARLFGKVPFHPSLRFELVHPTRPIYSVRIGLAYRALGVRDGDGIIWSDRFARRL